MVLLTDIVHEQGVVTASISDNAAVVVRHTGAVGGVPIAGGIHTRRDVAEAPRTCGVVLESRTSLRLDPLLGYSWQLYVLRIDR